MEEKLVRLEQQIAKLDANVEDLVRVIHKGNGDSLMTRLRIVERHCKETDARRHTFFHSLGPVAAAAFTAGGAVIMFILKQIFS